MHRRWNCSSAPGAWGRGGPARLVGTDARARVLWHSGTGMSISCACVCAYVMRVLCTHVCMSWARMCMRHARVMHTRVHVLGVHGHASCACYAHVCTCVFPSLPSLPTRIRPHPACQPVNLSACQPCSLPAAQIVGLAACWSCSHAQWPKRDKPCTPPSNVYACTHMHTHTHTPPRPPPSPLTHRTPLLVSVAPHPRTPARAHTCTHT